MRVRLRWLSLILLSGAWIGSVMADTAPGNTSPENTSPENTSSSSAMDAFPDDGASAFLIPVKLPTITPTQLYLTPDIKSAPLRVTNERDTAVRFALSVFAWGMRTDGTLRLEPTEAIRLSTDMLKLAPGETGEIQVAVKGQRDDREEAYRIRLSEHAEGEPVAANGMQVTAAITVPVFRRPLGTHPAGWLHAYPVEAGTLSIVLANRGSAHLFARDITVQGEDADGLPLFAITRDGWYILSDDRREYAATLADDDCRRVRHLRLTAHLLDGSTLEKGMEAGELLCGGNHPTGFSLPNGAL